MNLSTDFSNVTVVSITGEAGTFGGEAAVPSLVHSARQLPGSRALLISPERPPGLPSNIEHQRVKAFGLLEYSIFVLYALDYFIETDFVLIVQKDGWVLNAENWNDEFFQYDYIGAPSLSALMIDSQGGRTLIGNFAWQDYLARGEGIILPVYNGGFSLRSKRLLSLPRKLNLSIDVVPPNLEYRTGTPDRIFEMKWHSVNPAEDVQLCVFMRQALMSEGICYAPLNLALDFSIEFIGDAIHADHDFSRNFGTHLKYRRLESVDPLTIDCRGHAQDIEGLPRQMEMLKFLEKQYGYQVLI